MKFALVLLFLAAVLSGGFFLYTSFQAKNDIPTNPIERLAPNADRGGTDTFIRQIAASSGQLAADAGQPIFDNEPVVFAIPASPVSSSEVLGSHIAADGSEKWIEVDLSDQRLYAWEGNQKVYDFAISSGRPGYDTVQGEFSVWAKVRNQVYRGGSKERGDYYYLPNVPYSLFFYKGYAIHGAYWHNDFGMKRRSSGCVNLFPADAQQIYNWAGPAMQENMTAVRATADNPGVRVVVHE